VLKSLAVESFSGSRQPVDVKIAELSPASRAVNVKAKVVSKSDTRNIAAGRDGAPHRVCDALIGDETGCVYLTLWDDNIEKINEGDTINVGNGYVTLFKGNMRLNVGRFGTLEVAKEALAVEVNTENNMSSKVYEQQRRPFRGRRDFGGRERRGGYRQRRY
jgi:replication factor A1